MNNEVDDVSSSWPAVSPLAVDSSSAIVKAPPVLLELSFAPVEKKTII